MGAVGGSEILKRRDERAYGSEYGGDACMMTVTRVLWAEEVVWRTAKTFE